MKINKIIFVMLGLAVIVSGCTVNELTNESDLPEGAIVRLNFSSDASAPSQGEATRAAWEDSKGSGNLTFKWETVDIDSEEADEQVLIISDGKKPVSVKIPSREESASYSGLSITPREGDAHHASFQTVGYYATSDLRNAKYFFAVTGAPVITEDTGNGRHICELPDMPSAFAQTTDQDPSFLRDYMYMYSTSAYSGNGNTLSFKHIPATFRFIVSNGTDKAMPLEEIYMNISHNPDANSSTSVEIPDWNMVEMGITQMAVGEGAIASKHSTVTFDWSDGTSTLAFAEDAHEKVSVTTADGTKVAAGGRYTAYAMALPLADDNAFSGKTVNFTIKSNGTEQIAFQLSGERLAEINGADISNWVSGKSYTIRINIGADGKVTGYIIEDKIIEVNSNIHQTYTLKYEDANGKPLADYADICTLEVDEVAYYRDFINVNVAPREAETIGIYDSEGVRQGTIQITDLKPDYSEEPLYSFGLLSDVHIGRNNDYISAVEDFKCALTFFKEKGAALTCICGDITQNGTEAELQQYEQAVLDVSARNVLTTTGNHDCIENSRYGVDPELWSQYTHVPLVFEYSKETNGKVDYFLFLGMSYWNYGAAYLDYHINWLEAKLEAYRNDRCFVITHLFFPGRVGNVNEIYPSGNWLYGLQLERLTSLCDHYVNTIWFSGHSHWEWAMQGEDNNDKDDESPNIYRTYSGSTPTSGWCVHVPSCGVPSTLNENNERWEVNPGSEGALVQVYENHIDIIGRDFNSGKYLPIATYRLDTTPKQIVKDDTPREAHYLEAADFIHAKGDSKHMSIVDVEGMPNYIDAIFEAQSQGYWVANNTFYQGISNAVSLTIEDVTCWTHWDQEKKSGDRVDTIDMVGFYASQNDSDRYFLTSTNAVAVNNLNGAQFQTSSRSDESLYPIKVRMKAQMVFSPAYEGGDEQPKHYLKASHFMKNPNKSEGDFSVKDSDDPDYVEVEFSGNSQGFYVKNETFFYGMSKDDGQQVSIIVEDIIAYEKEGGNWKEFPISDVSRVGFYARDYLLQSSSGVVYVNAAQGVQFQTKSTFADSDAKNPESLKLKMKVRMVYYTTKTPEIASKYYIKPEDFKKNNSKETGTVQNVEGEPNMIEVEFTGKSQGWLIYPDRDDLSKSQYATVKISDLQIWVDGTQVEEISGIGFRNQDGYKYFLNEDFTDIIRNNGVDGIEFQSSGSEYNGQYPVKIRMKAAMIGY